MPTNQTTSAPVHGCDGCTACCKTLHIRELNKPGDTWCRHCSIGVGCGIYDDRPESCRVYECVWLQTQRGGRPLAPELRPDKSRVVLGVTNGGDDLVLYVDPDRPDAWKRGAMAKLVAEMRAKGFAVLVKCGERLQHL
ncbi:MAG: hypothetical protein WC830_09965 [Burkholderiales bacterium]|jgi:hypothetical protein